MKLYISPIQSTQTYQADLSTAQHVGKGGIWDCPRFALDKSKLPSEVLQGVVNVMNQRCGVVDLKADDLVLYLELDESSCNDWLIADWVLDFGVVEYRHVFQMYLRNSETKELRNLIPA